MSESDSIRLSILLDTAIKKHESILANIRSLDIKTSIYLAFLGILIIPSIDFLNSEGRKIISILNIWPILFSTIGITLCLFALFPQKSKATAKLNPLRESYTKREDPDKIKADLFSYYEDAYEYNLSIAKQKLRFICFIYLFMALAFVAIIVITILKGVFNA